VIHAGLYHAPGSRKARLCVQGRQHLYRYCAERGITHRRCGKLLVATSTEELVTLQDYLHNARRNGVTNLEWRTPEQVAAMEPEVRCTHRVYVQQDSTSAELEARTLVNAAGLHAQEVARQLHGLEAASIPPRFLAKGHYFTLQGEAPFRHLIYPVPGDAGLGIHVTLDTAGSVRFGPDVEWISDIDYSIDESRRADFARAIRRYYPSLDATRLQPGYTGIRPKTVGPGEVAADFRIQGPQAHGWEGLVNLYGIESPGLTASLAIADEVAAMLGVADA
jgi:L-2-hydroxyglutarate oxidase LhgO